jgi:hypothetical protein
MRNNCQVFLHNDDVYVVCKRFTVTLGLIITVTLELNRPQALHDGGNCRHPPFILTHTVPRRRINNRMYSNESRVYQAGLEMEKR